MNGARRAALWIAGVCGVIGAGILFALPWVEPNDLALPERLGCNAGLLLVTAIIAIIAAFAP